MGFIGNRSGLHPFQLHEEGLLFKQDIFVFNQVLEHFFIGFEVQNKSHEVQIDQSVEIYVS